MTEHTTTHKKHTRAHTHTEGYFGGGGGGFFFFFVFFLSYSHYKRKKGQGPVELTKELTNITKILQFVNISSTLSAFMNRAGDPGCVGRVGASERCQLRLWNSFFFFFSFPTEVARDLAVKILFSGVYRPPSSQAGGGSIVHKHFLQTAPPPDDLPLFTLSTQLL